MMNSCLLERKSVHEEVLSCWYKYMHVYIRTNKKQLLVILPWWNSIPFKHVHQ